MALSSSIEHAVPKQPNRHSANSWIAKADEDIDTVDLCLSAGGRLANVAAFHTQQAAEKLLKALIAIAGIEPPRVHDLAELTDLAGEAKSDVRTLAENIETITSWAVLTHYPSHGDTPPPTTGEIADALRAGQTASHAGREGGLGLKTLSQGLDFVVCATARGRYILASMERQYRGGEHPDGVFARYGAQKLGSARRPHKIYLTFTIVLL
jgi:HEPN domain-containing protein